MSIPTDHPSFPTAAIIIALTAIGLLATAGLVLILFGWGEP